MPTKIQVRRGTASQWTTSNPVLSAGELGFETDTTKFKIGDGTTNWAGLDYLDYTDARVDDRIAVASVGDLSDVDTTGATDGDVLAFDSGLWVPQMPEPAGKVLDVKQVSFTETFTIQLGTSDSIGSAYQPVPNVGSNSLSISHSVSNPANKVLLTCNIGLFVMGNAQNDENGGGIAFAAGDDIIGTPEFFSNKRSLTAGATSKENIEGKRGQPVAASLLYSPGSTNAVLYRTLLVNATTANGVTIRINRVLDDGNRSPLSISTLTLMEIAG